MVVGTSADDDRPVGDVVEAATAQRQARQLLFHARHARRVGADVVHVACHVLTHRGLPMRGAVRIEDRARAHAVGRAAITDPGDVHAAIAGPRETADEPGDADARTETLDIQTPRNLAAGTRRQLDDRALRVVVGHDAGRWLHQWLRRAARQQDPHPDTPQTPDRPHVRLPFANGSEPYQSRDGLELVPDPRSARGPRWPRGRQSIEPYELHAPVPGTSFF